MLNEAALISLANDVLLPGFDKDALNLTRLDRWSRWSHDQPHAPRQATVEYRQLADRAHAPWLMIPINSISQQMYVDGFRAPSDPDDAEVWSCWQANAMDSRQVAIHRAALTYGLAYVTVLHGVGPMGPMPVMRGVSPRKMFVVYDDPAEDDWPVYAMRVDIKGDKRQLRIYDEQNIYTLIAPKIGGFEKPEFLGVEAHGMGVCPVVRYSNSLDLEGRSLSEIEPLIPLAGRIDQTVFDRLVVQRFSSWIVRTIAGMAQPEPTPGDPSLDSLQQQAQLKLRLKVEDLLISEDPDTKFGTLAATPLNGFIEAKDADLRDLAALSQVPAHHLLGSTMSNLSAEALAASEESLTRKIEERKQSFGESHEQVLRLATQAMGGACDFESEVHWRDMTSQSLGVAADALGKLATMLGIPVEFLWEKVPGWTQADVERIEELVAEQSAQSPAITVPADPGSTDPGNPPPDNQTEGDTSNG